MATHYNVYVHEVEEFLEARDFCVARCIKTVCTLLYKMTKFLYRVSREECARLRESVPYVKLYRYNPKHLYPKLNSYGDNGQRSLKL